MLDWLVSEVRDAFAQPDAARFALDLSSRRVALVERTRAGVATRGVADHNAPDFDERIRKLRRIVQRNPNAPARVDILLPAELTLYRIETFPDDALSDLRREAWWRLERWAPYRPEELCYDVAVLESDPRTGFVSVAAVVAPREIVEEAVAYVREWGFRPQRVSVAADFEGFPNGPVLFEPANPRRELRALRRRAAALAAIALLMGCLGAYRGVSERESEAAAAEARLAATRTELDAALRVRQATLTLADRSVKPLRARDMRYLAAEKLRAVAAALPEGATVEAVLLDGRLARVSGVAPNVAAAVEALERSPVFEAAREAETAGRAPADPAGARRFAIEARVSARAPDT